MDTELSREATELFPGINVANFLTITTGTLEKNDIETIIEVSDKCQENNHLRSVLHVDANKVDTEESFNLIADLIDQKKQSDSNVAIVCEKGPNLAAALSLTHPIKYDGYQTSKAAQIVLKKRPNTELDERLMAKLKKWEWKVRKERMLRRSVEVAGGGGRWRAGGGPPKIWYCPLKALLFSIAHKSDISSITQILSFFLSSLLQPPPQMTGDMLLFP